MDNLLGWFSTKTTDLVVVEDDDDDAGRNGDDDEQDGSKRRHQQRAAPERQDLTIATNEEDLGRSNTAVAASAAVDTEADGSLCVAECGHDEEEETTSSTTTPQLYDKFAALGSEWSSATSIKRIGAEKRPRPQRLELESETEELNDKLRALQEKHYSIHQSAGTAPTHTPIRTTGSGPCHIGGANGGYNSPFHTNTMRLEQQQQQYTPQSIGRTSSWSVASRESSLGRTTLSSHDTLRDRQQPRESVFERLYRNEKRYRRRRSSPGPGALLPPPPPWSSSPRSHDSSSASYSLNSSSVLEKRLAYVAPGDVYRLRRREERRRAGARSVTSSSTPLSAKTDSVFERLYRREPRARSLLTPANTASWSHTVTATPRSSQSVAAITTPTASSSSSSPRRKVATPQSILSLARPSFTSTNRTAVFERLHQGLSSVPQRRERWTGTSASSVQSTPAAVAPRLSTLTGQKSVSAAASSTSGSATPLGRLLYQQPHSKREHSMPVNNARTPINSPRRRPQFSSQVSVQSAASAPAHSTSKRALYSRTKETDLFAPSMASSSRTPADSSHEAKDSVFERLYRNAPRSTVPGSSSSSVAAKSRLAVRGTTSLDGAITQQLETKNLSASSVKQQRSDRSASPSRIRSTSSKTVPSQSSAALERRAAINRLHRGEPSPVRKSKVQSTTAPLPSRQGIDSESPLSSRAEKMGPSSRRMVDRKTPLKTNVSISRSKPIRSIASSEESGASTATPTSLISATSATTPPNTHHSSLVEQDSPMGGKEHFFDDRGHEAVYNEEDSIAMEFMAAVFLQSWLRGCRVRSELAYRYIAAKRIQMAWRKFQLGCHELPAHMCSDLSVCDSDDCSYVMPDSRQYTQGEIETAATLLQSAFRTFQQRRAFDQMKLAAVRIQAISRMQLHRSWLQRQLSSNSLHSSPQKLKAADAALQRWQNQNSRQKKSHQRNNSAAKLQAKWRSYVTRMRFLEFRMAYHQFIMEAELREFTAASKIQRQWRRFFIQRAFTEARWALITVEALLQGRPYRRDLDMFNSASTRLQNWNRWRLQLSAVSIEEDFTLQHMWATIIQSSWRAYLARRDYIHYRAAKTIQRRWRVTRDRFSFILDMSWRTIAAETVQATYRAKNVRARFLKYRSAAVKIQSLRRGILVRRRISVYQASAICLHHNISLSSESDASYCESARRIQTTWRMHVAKTSYNNHLSARKLQNTWRKFYVRLAYTEARVSAALVQSNVRGHLFRKQHHSFNRMACIIQQTWRQRTDRLQTNKSVQAYYSTLAIQKKWRLYQSVQHLSLNRSAAVKIQGWIRRTMARQRYQSAARLAAVLQRSWRIRQFRFSLLDALERNRTEHLWRMQRNLEFASAVAIQSKWRSIQARQELRKYFSALAIQKQWRVYQSVQARQELRKYFSALAIQKQWRVYQSVQHLSLNRSAAVKIQGWIRRTMARQRYQSATRLAAVLQRSWRVRQFRFSLLDAMERNRTERFWRMQQNLEFASAVAIQSKWRSIQARQELRKYFSALAIQKQWRLYQSVQHLSLNRSAALKIQGWIRRTMARQRYQSAARLAAVLQKSWRVRQFRFSLLDALERNRTERLWRMQRNLEFASAVAIQSKWRSIQARVELRKYYSALAIQKQWRLYQSVNTLSLNRSAAVQIQGWIRRTMARQRYQSAARLAAVLRRSWRVRQFRFSLLDALNRNRTERLWRMQRNLDFASAVAIQSKWRSIQAREELRKYYSALAMQKQWRLYQSVQHLSLNRAAALKIQGWIRRTMARQRYQSAARLAAVLQKSWRVRQFRFSLLDALERNRTERLWRMQRNLDFASAVAIQSKWRAIQAREELRKYYSAVAIQKQLRLYQSVKHLSLNRSAAVKIQGWIRRTMARKRYQSATRLAAALQRSWRVRQFRFSLLDALERNRTERFWRMQRNLEFASAVAIQSKWRSIQARQELRKYFSAFTIQKQWRLYQSVQHLSLNRSAAVKIQGWIRRTMARQRYQSATRLAAVLQRSWRVRQFRFSLLDAMERNRTERLWRMQRYLDFASALAIQSKWRSIQAREELRKYFSALAIQKQWRLYQSVQHLSLNRSAALKIQGWIRRTMARQRYHSATRLAAVLQRNWRIRQFRFLLLDALIRNRTERLWRMQRNLEFASAVAIQSKWRSIQAREELRKYYSALAIQKQWRLYQSVQHVSLNRSAALKIQGWIRRTMARQRYQSAARLAAVLQKSWRVRQFRFSLLDALERNRTERFWRMQRNLEFASTVAIQSKWRSIQARQELRKYFSALAIQKQWRLYQSVKHLSLNRSAAVKIQMWIRGTIARKRYQSAARLAAVLQRSWRVRQFRFSLLDAMERNRTERLWRMQRNLEFASAVAIQSKWRSIQAREELRKYYSALAIQKQWRLYQSVQHLSLILSAALKIQGWIRRTMARQRYQSAAVLQRNWRIRQFRFSLLDSMERNRTERLLCMQHKHEFASAVAIQSKWRSIQSREELRKYYSAVALQKQLRLYQSVKHLSLNRSAAVKIQGWIRGIFVRSWIQQYADSSRAIQYWWRYHFLKRKRNDQSTAYALFLHLNASSIQCKWKARRSFRLEICFLAATKIQTMYRAVRTRKRYVLFVESVVALQSALRRKSICRVLQRWHHVSRRVALAWLVYKNSLTYRAVKNRRTTAAILIQLSYIDWKLKQKVPKFASAVELLSRTMRGSFSRTTAVYSLLQINAFLSSPTTSSFFRIVALSSFKHLVTKNHLVRLENTARRLAAILIQCFVRGCLCRSKLSNNQREQVSLRMFSVPLFCRHVEKSTAEEIGGVSNISLSSGDDDASHDIYQDRLESRAREVIFARAEALASVDVARLSCGYDLDPTPPCHPGQARDNHCPTPSTLTPSYSVVVESDSEVYRNSPSSKFEVIQEVNGFPLPSGGDSPPLDQINRNDIATLDCVLTANEGFEHAENITRDGVRKSVQAQTSSGSIWNSWWS